MTDGCRSVRDGIFLYTLSLFYSAVVSLRVGSSLSPSPAVLFAFWQHKHYHESSEQSSDYPQNLLFRHIFFLRRSELR